MLSLPDFGFNGRQWSRLARVLLAMCCLGALEAQAVTISVKGSDGQTVQGFRYTIEEDPTYEHKPDVTGLSGDADASLSLAFHRSYARVVKVGRTNSGTVTFDRPDSTKRYFVTVMPDNPGFGDATPNGYTMSGVSIRPDAAAVVVPVNKLPFKTAQISVFVFEDNAPANGAPDSPGVQEKALCGWEVQLFEAGGTYGASGGRVATDTFGNPLGTEYAFHPDGSPQYETDGSLKIAKIGANQLWTDRNGVMRIKNLSPAKYTIYSIPPNEMPSAKRCNFPDADGNPTSTPIWVRTAAQRTHRDADGNLDQMVWDSQYELAVGPLVPDQSKWHQTTTIEGTWGVDAWVKAGEPTFFKEFGPPGHHVWHGFIRRFKDTAQDTGLLASGGVTLTGKVVSTHMSRPPGIRFHSGAPMTACWIAINEIVTGTGMGRTLYANSCTESNPGGADGTFRVAGLRPGTRYQLSVWDEPLDNVIANYEFTTGANGTLAMGDVPVFSWFSNLQGKVFYDKEGTGFLFDSAGNEKPGIPQSIVNIRFRDGSIYQSTVTDDEGRYVFPEFFPFFNWMVAETDFTRLKATGATVIADNGGAVVDPAFYSLPEGLWPASTLAPQIQPDYDNLPFRIFGGLDTGLTVTPNSQPVAPSSANLLQAIQGFLGQTNVIHWGKKEYNPADATDHGGITGVVHYASTRAEFDPRFATAENNEPGIPSVEIRLYKLDNNNMVIDPAAPNGPRIAPKDATAAHAVQIALSDNFDLMRPDRCIDPNPYRSPEDGTGLNFGNGDGTGRCYDGMRIWNQVRDGAFDGGWAFVDHCPSGLVVTSQRDANGNLIVNDDNTVNVSCVGGTDPVPLPPGRYMTEAVAPYGYEHQKEEDKNVDFGDLLSPGTLANPAECLGSRSEIITYDADGNPVLIADPSVPLELELFPGVEIPERFRTNRPYCNKKLVVVAPGMNPFSDFHMFSKAPVAGHIVGMILDDLANEFDPYSPSFGEKYAPPFMPISIRDYAGNEINRVYSDRYGTYNAMVPSTFAYNVPLPSGVAPNMVNVCLNSPTMKDPADPTKTILDPNFNPQYSQYCYTFQYLPGKTTYLDTPVLPIAAFAGPSQYALDTEAPDGTPAIKMVTGTTTVGGVAPGPWVPAGGQVQLTSMGMTDVPNPNYEQTKLGTPGQVAPKTFKRDYGFGSSGTVRIGGTTVAANWSNNLITFTVPAGTPAGAYQVEVTRGTGTAARKAVRGVVLNVGGRQPITVGQDTSQSYAHRSIQAAIDAAQDGDLITVAPGLYEEAPIVWKRVRVQGHGAPVTIVNASTGAESLRQQAWRTKVCDLVFNQGMGDALVPGQTLPANLAACLTGDTVDNTPLLFATEESSGFFVLQHNRTANANNQAFAASNLPALRIDGFTVTGADTGGGVVANGHAAQLEISNNRILGNQGLYNGGIRIGHANLLVNVPGGNGDTVEEPGGSNSPLVSIHHNEITKNGNLAGDFSGGGGGVSIYTGAPGYLVAHNLIAGNFSTGDGGGMLHHGRSSTLQVTGVSSNAINNGTYLARENRIAAGNNNNRTLSYSSLILDNEFRFNQSFSQAKTVQGGGLAIMGAMDPVANNGLSTGTGNVVVANNLFQGNLAGAGDGGGIALVGVNGTEVPGAQQSAWFRADVINNVIVNNGAGVAGGGISLLDSPNVFIANNTVSVNDSYATGARAFANGDPTQAGNGTTVASRIATSSLQNGAGIAAYAHSTPFRAAVNQASQVSQNTRTFSNATLQNNVVLANRRYQWRINYNQDQTQSGCAYDATGANPCFGLGHLQGGTLVTGPASQTDVGNDIAVLGAGNNARLSPTYSVFTNTQANDGTSGNTNRTGVTTDFNSWYVNGQRGALKQLVYSLEQSIVKGMPVGEVQEPTVASTAAAFDEGGNFIDVRFGPLTRGSCLTPTTFNNANCAAAWADFGTYHPTTAARAQNSGDFRGGTNATPNGTSALVSTLLGADREGNARSNNNWIRGALAQ